MKSISQDRTELPSDMEFTVHVKRAIVKTINDPYFRDRDPELMFKALMAEIRSVSFGEYLKRFILEKEPDLMSVYSTDEDAYLDYLCNAFKRAAVPSSFSPTTAKLRALAKNWLSQRVVNRNVVFLLGFALKMKPEEVNEFLLKAIKESKIDPKDPFEVICWYCYQFHFPYSKFAELWNIVSGGELAKDDGLSLMSENTVRVRKDMESISTETQLLEYLSRLNLIDRSGRQSIAARHQFDELYHQACVYCAEIKTEIEKKDVQTKAIRFADNLYRSDRIYDYQKEERIQKARSLFHKYKAEEITPGDFENILYSAIPKDKNGNLIPMKESLLNVQFSGKRLNRQHISEILDGKGAISRFDIITLCFFDVANDPQDYQNNKDRYDLFARKVNGCLAKSDMEPLYVANPYESFVLMCMLTDDPLGSFSDVWELSYRTV